MIPSYTEGEAYVYGKGRGLFGVFGNFRELV